MTSRGLPLRSSSYILPAPSSCVEGFGRLRTACTATPALNKDQSCRLCFSKDFLRQPRSGAIFHLMLMGRGRYSVADGNPWQQHAVRADWGSTLCSLFCESAQKLPFCLAPSGFYGRYLTSKKGTLLPCSWKNSMFPICGLKKASDTDNAHITHVLLLRMLTRAGPPLLRLCPRRGLPAGPRGVGKLVQHRPLEQVPLRKRKLP